MIKDWFKFVIHPDRSRNDPSIKLTLRNFVKLYLFDFLATVGLLVFIGLVQLIFKLRATPDDFWGFSKTLIIVSIVSMIEELVFRLPLRFTPFNVALPLSLVSTVFLLLPIKNFGWPHWVNRSILVFSILILLGVFYLVFSRPAIRLSIEALYRKHFIWVFYGFSLTFAFAHFFNYRPGGWISYLAIPLITLPQLQTGLILSYLRLRYHIIWSILYHVFWNMVVFVTVLKHSVLSGLGLMVVVILVMLAFSEIIPESWGRKAPGDREDQAAETEDEPGINKDEVHTGSDPWSPPSQTVN